MWYAFWASCVFIQGIGFATLATWAKGAPGWRWVIALYVLQLVGIWPFVAKFSKNLVFDALLFDLLLITSFYGTILLLGGGDKFTWCQWGGVSLALGGLVLVKIGG